MNTLYSEIIDTRDLIERRTEIEEELELDDNEILDEEQREARVELETELAEIQEIEDNVSDFPYGETLIREDHFTEYAQQLAKDIDGISDDAQWPLTYIDWERAADALKIDYTTVEYQGNTYYARA